MFWLALVVACASGPTLTGVDPDEVHPGDGLRVLGDGLADNAEAYVFTEADPTPYALEEVSVEGGKSLIARVPVGLVPGRYTVGVRQGDRGATLPVALVVAPLPVETPCAGEFTANTQISLAQKLVVIDRFFRNGDRETLKLDLGDIDHVERAVAAHPVRGRCDAVWLVKTDGGRVLFVDDGAVDLSERARRIADSLGRPLTDAPAESAP